jgi:hypothetical protein
MRIDEVARSPSGLGPTHCGVASGGRFPTNKIGFQKFPLPLRSFCNDAIPLSIPAGSLQLAHLFLDACDAVDVYPWVAVGA